MSAKFTISAVIRAVDKITAPMAAITRKLTTMNGPIGKVSRGLQSIAYNQDFRRITGAIKNLGVVSLNAAKSVAKIAAGLIAIGSAAATAGLLAVSKGFADAGDEAATTATKLGITTQELQRMRFAGDMLDVSNETLDAGLGKLSRSIVMASKGAKDQVKALRLLGYTDKQIASGRISVVDATTRLAARMEDEKKAKSNAIIANALYSKSYQDMLPMLKAGGTAIAELAAEAERLGLVMDEKAIKSAEAYDDATKRMSYSLTGLRNVIGAQVLPIIIPMIQKIQEWVVANRELIATKVQEFLQAMAKALSQVDWNKAIAAASAFGNGLVKLAENITLLKWAFAGFIAVGMMPAIMAVGSLAKAIAIPLLAALGNFAIGIRAGMGVMAAFNAVLASNPISLIILSLAALGAAGYMLIKHWDKVAGFFSGMWNQMKEDVATVGAIIGGVFDKLSEKVMGFINGIKESFARVKSLVTDNAIGRWVAGKSADENDGAAPPLAQRGLRRSNASMANQSEAKVQVEFKNAPKGTRFESDVKGKGMNLGVDVGYQTGGAI